MTKVCPDCGIEKPVAEFGRNASLRDGLQFYCKGCCSRRSAEVYRRKRERMGRSVRAPRDVPPGHKYCPGCQQVKPLSKWHRNRKARDGFSSYCKICRKSQSRADYLRRTFDLTDDDVAAMIEAQGGVCAICRDAEPQHIDHDHKTGYLEPTYRRLTATMHAVEAPRWCVIEIGQLHRAA